MRREGASEAWRGLPPTSRQDSLRWTTSRKRGGARRPPPRRKSPQKTRPPRTRAPQPTAASHLAAGASGRSPCGRDAPVASDADLRTTRSRENDQTAWDSPSASSPRGRFETRSAHRHSTQLRLAGEANIGREVSLGQTDPMLQILGTKGTEFVAPLACLCADRSGPIPLSSDVSRAILRRQGIGQASWQKRVGVMQASHHFHLSSLAWRESMRKPLSEGVENWRNGPGTLNFGRTLFNPPVKADPPPAAGGAMSGGFGNAVCRLYPCWHQEGQCGSSPGTNFDEH